MAMISYAQNREDVLLSRAFPGPVGCYIDVGAADPVEYSVTKCFYDRGWSGINLEPQPGYYQALLAGRPRDVNLNVGVSDRPGTVTLYEAPDHAGWSTMEAGVADEFRSKGIEVIERAVTVLTLAEVCERYAHGPIDFLKLDVEGHEPHVLRGADFTRWRPRVLVIEATEVGRPTPNYEAWEPTVLAAGYTFAAFDGLNRYYVRAGDEELIPKLRVPPNVFDEFIPYEWLKVRDDLAREAAEAWAALGRVSADRDAEKARADNFTTAFECRTKEAEEYKAKADHYVTAFECRTREAEEFKAKADNYTAAFEARTREAEEQRARADNFAAAFECRTREAEEYKAKADNYVTAFECRTQEAERYRAEAENYKTAFDCRTQEVEALQARLAAAAADLAARTGERDGLAAELADARDRLARATRTAAGLRTAYDTAVALLGRARAHADELRAEMIRAAEPV